MEVIVSLLPLVANSKTQKVVLILSSLVAVNWSIIAHGVRGHISVHVRNISLCISAYRFKNGIHTVIII